MKAAFRREDVAAHPLTSDACRSFPHQELIVAIRRRLVPSVLAASTLAAAGIALLGAPTSATASTAAPVFTNLAAPATLANADNAGEPSLGVNGSTGSLMYQAYASTYKVNVNPTTGTPTWSDVTAPGVGFNIDPIAATDRTTGRTFAGGLAGECSALAYTDNDGGSWTQMGNACAGVFDHESIGSGPWHGSAPLGATYSHAVYYCAQNGNDSCVTSTNGGLSFGAPTLVGGACGGLHGHIKVAPNGTAYLPSAHCGGVAGGGITTNNGTSWSSYTIPGSTEPATGFDPSVTITPDNTVYEAWQQGDNHPYVARSTTNGSSWDRVTDLSGTVNPPIVNSTFQATTSGDNGRVAVAYLGSTTAGDPFSSTWHGVWDLYVSTSYDGGLTWTTVKATTDPVQRGWMCASGTTCNSGRNLLDFMDANMTKDGRVVVGYADGCINACALSTGTEAQSTDAYATIAYQSDGKNLLAAYDGTAPAPSPSPSPTAASPSPSPSPSPSATTTSPSPSPTTASPSPTATTPADPDPATPNLTSGTAVTGTSAPAGGFTYYKVNVPAGAASLKVTLKGPNCNGKGGCNPDLDLYGQAGSKPTTSSTTKSATAGSNAETFSVSPASGYYYVGVYTATGSKTGSFSLTATLG
jgi:hypothetical protein